MIFLLTVNQLMITSAITQLSTSPRPSLSLKGKQIHMSGLDMVHRQFYITPKYNYKVAPIGWQPRQARAVPAPVARGRNGPQDHCPMPIKG